ncbi:hypothetical protein AVEN_216783-1 [Araneus ventricosus]|uniref:Uncharacterized protein n=1 Tax=Araneus ventricosus TaxID=182803 RepID=A0A4Y2N5J8_ARAVE|nr:hypothetical protein AVEN_216783-1 [Araneus ventricosus]
MQIKLIYENNLPAGLFYPGLSSMIPQNGICCALQFSDENLLAFGDSCPPTGAAFDIGRVLCDRASSGIAATNYGVGRLDEGH